MPTQDGQPLAVQVVRTLLSARLPAAPDQAEVIERQAASLSSHPRAPSLKLRISIGHADCLARCVRSMPVEEWTIQLEEETVGQPALPAMFLVNAIRSHSHFSQLSAWLARCCEVEREAFACSFESVHTPTDLYAPTGGSIAEHSFPVAVDSVKNCRLRVSVRFVQREEMVRPAGLCLQLGPLPSDEWLLPSPIPSPTGREDAGAMVESALLSLTEAFIGAKHKATDPLAYSPTGPMVKRGFEQQLQQVTKRVEKERERKRSSVSPAQRKREERGEQQVQSTARRALQLKEGKTPRRVDRRRSLLGSFEESALRGLFGGKSIEGYHAQIAAAGLSLVCAPATIPLDTVALETDEECAGWCVSRGSPVSGATSKKGYRIPERGNVQMTLLNPEGSAVRVFIVNYDLTKLPPASCSFIRHRITMDPIDGAKQGKTRFLLHLPVHSDRSGRVFLAGELKLLFTTDTASEALNIETDSNGVGRDARKFDTRTATILPAHSARLKRVRKGSIPCLI